MLVFIEKESDQSGWKLTPVHHGASHLAHEFHPIGHVWGLLGSVEAPPHS